MTVSAVTSTGSATGASSTGAATSAVSATNQLSYNDFLTILMSELQNQDPTQPMDPGQMVTQLSTVSEVGQTIQTNTTLQSMLTSNSLSQAELLVGQTISSSDGTKSGTVTSVNVTNTGATATLANGDTVPLASGAVIK